MVPSYNKEACKVLKEMSLLWCLFCKVCVCMCSWGDMTVCQTPHRSMLGYHDVDVWRLYHWRGRWDTIRYVVPMWRGYGYNSTMYPCKWDLGTAPATLSRVQSVCHFWWQLASDGNLPGAKLGVWVVCHFWPLVFHASPSFCLDEVRAGPRVAPSHKFRVCLSDHSCHSEIPPYHLDLLYHLQKDPGIEWTLFINFLL